jgi:hypothetical protein
MSEGYLIIFITTRDGLYERLVSKRRVPEQLVAREHGNAYVSLDHHMFSELVALQEGNI